MDDVLYLQSPVRIGSPLSKAMPPRVVKISQLGADARLRVEHNAMKQRRMLILSWECGGPLRIIPTTPTNHSGTLGRLTNIGLVSYTARYSEVASCGILNLALPSAYLPKGLAAKHAR